MLQAYSLHICTMYSALSACNKLAGEYCQYWLIIDRPFEPLSIRTTTKDIKILKFGRNKTNIRGVESFISANHIQYPWTW